MKISKKEKILLLILLVVLVVGAYYYFFFRKHQESIANLKQEKATQQEVNDTIQVKLISGTNLDKEIKENSEKIKELAKSNFPSLVQEKQTVLLKKLSRDTGLKIKTLEFSREIYTIADIQNMFNSELEEQRSYLELSNDEKINNEENNANAALGSEAFVDSLVDVLSVNVNFEGDYQAINNYIRNMKEYEKNIVVQELSFNSDSSNDRTGNMKISFFGIRDLDSELAKNQFDSAFVMNSFDDDFMRLIPATAYFPYENFVVLDTINSSDSTWTGGSIDVDTVKDNSKTIDSFEAFDVFFVGSGSDVNGKVRLSSLSADRRRSINMTYEFLNPALTNQANLVFDKNKRMIYSDASSVGLSVYLKTPLGENKIGFVIVDSSGKEVEYYFESPEETGKWVHLEQSIDSQLQYPIMIQRLFVEGEGIYQVVEGSIYFDDLRYVPAQ